MWRFHSVVQDGERPGRELRMYASMSWPRGARLGPRDEPKPQRVPHGQALRRPAAVGAELGRQLLVDEAIDLVELASVLDPAAPDPKKRAKERAFCDLAASAAAPRSPCDPRGSPRRAPQGRSWLLRATVRAVQEIV